MDFLFNIISYYIIGFISVAVAIVFLIVFCCDVGDLSGFNDILDAFTDKKKDD